MPDKSSEEMTVKEFQEHIDKWWADRRQAAIDLSGWVGRDLRNQDQLIQTVLGLEEDVTQLLRYVTAIFKRLPDKNAPAPKSNKEKKMDEDEDTEFDFD